MWVTSLGLIVTLDPSSWIAIDYYTDWDWIAIDYYTDWDWIAINYYTDWDSSTEELHSLGRLHLTWSATD